jgi:hypothetical protein
LITTRNYFSKCDFLVDHVCSNDDNEMKLTEDDKNDWHSLQTLGTQFEDYTPMKVLSSFVKSTVLIRCWTKS